MLNFNLEIIKITLVSVQVAGTSTILATILGVPLGFIIGLNQFRGRKLVVIILHSLLSVPTVVIGLMIYLCISRSGPLGSLGLLYTPTAMVIGQTILAFPIICALVISVIDSQDPCIIQTAKSLGANTLQSMYLVFLENRNSIFAAISVGFSRVFSEIGISLILGGNIKGYTRNLPTTIALETGKGEFVVAIISGIVLLFIAFTVNFIIQLFIPSQNNLFNTYSLKVKNEL